MVYAVVVTYNRLPLLKEGLIGLRNQTKKLDKIIVVNNGSSDGTKDWLKSQTDIKVINQENTGGAGGFYTGVKFAYENGADWVWTMDDDVVPNYDCLEELMNYSSFSKCLHPSRETRDGLKYFWGEYLDLKKYRKYKLTEVEINDKNIYYPNVGCFEGMLISSEVIEKIGFPDSRFFISGDDTIYGYLASFHTNVSCVNSAKMIRAKSSLDNKVSPMYMYYVYRNFHLYEDYLKKTANKTFSFSVKLKYFMTGLAVIVNLIFKNYTFLEKLKVAKSIIRGILHSKQKKINKSF